MARSPFSLPIRQEARPHSGALPSQRTLVLSFCLVLAGLMGGALLSLRWQEQAAPVASAGRESNTALVAATIKRLEDQQTDLKAQIGDLRDKLSTLQASQATNKNSLGEVTDEISSEQTAAGLVALEGSGIIARFDDSTTSSVPPSEDPANYILHDFDLRDITNTLWGAGAEAISINRQRIVATSSIYCVGTTIIVNVTRLSPPYVVTAVGDPAALEAALHNADQMAALNQRSLIYDLPIGINKEAKVTVPAYEGSITYRYATVSDDLSGEPTLTPSK